MENNMLSVEDMNYFVQQSKGKLNMILAGMTELLSDNDRKVEMLQSQTWFQRMARTLTGKNKLTKQEIERNHEKINVYIAQAITELYRQNCIDRQIIMDLGSRLNDLAATQLKIKQMMGAFIVRLNEKIESIDHFHLLMEEIEMGIFSQDKAFAALCEIVPLIDRRTILDERKMILLQKNLERQGFFTEEEKPWTQYLAEIMEIPSDKIGTLYLELKTIPENRSSQAILYVIEHYHFLSEKEQKCINKEMLAKQAVKETWKKAEIRWWTEKGIFLDILKSKELRAEFELGKDYAEGRGVEQDYCKAVKWYKKAAMQGFAKAQNNLGICYFQGTGVVEDKKEAVKWYRKAAEQRLVLAQNTLGDCYYYGTGVEQSDAEAVKWYEKAAIQGYASGQYNLAFCYQRGKGTEQSDTEAVKWYQKAAVQGETFAQVCLGAYYMDGTVVEKDEKKAVKWYRKAAESENVIAQNELGECYYYGIGVEKDEKEAVKWYEKAAEQGDAEAQFSLGFCYDNGRGAEKNDAEAVKWYRKAAEQGHMSAQCNLGIHYDFGRGIEKDEKEAVRWYRKAAEQGDAEAQNNLGVCYEGGTGVEQDDVEAIRWYRKAAEQGNASAKKVLSMKYDIYI